MGHNPQLKTDHFLFTGYLLYKGTGINDLNPVEIFYLQEMIVS
jgi:hypothetical protein